MKELILKIFLLFFCIGILLLGVKGLPGNPISIELNTQKWKDNGPLELSPDRGRFALMYSLIEDNSFHFSVPVARFATPDLGYKDGKYVSLFAPAVSFIVAPGYIFGKAFGISQVGTFLVVSLFAIMNLFILRSIMIKLGANRAAATLASLIFLFATPAFPYAVSLYQHHITTFIILFSLWLILNYKNKTALALIWFLAAASIPVDYPNLFFMLPVGIYALSRAVDLKKQKEKYLIKFNLLVLFTFITVLIPLGFFFWFNMMSYGNPIQFSGTVASVKEIDEYGNPTAPGSSGQEDVSKFISPEKQEKSSVRFFNTREILHLLYTHLLSPNRGVLFFTPIIYLGILGIPLLYKRQLVFTSLLLAIIGFNLLLYSMFGEGGWAFGSRYLIPSYAVLSIFLAFALTEFRRKGFILLLFLILAVYSVSVNTLGALTTNRVPHKVEATALERISGRKEHYTYLRNWEFLMSNHSKSFVYQTFAKDYVTAPQYFYLVAGSIILVMSGQVTYMYLKARKES